MSSHPSWSQSRSENKSSSWSWSWSCPFSTGSKESFEYSKQVVLPDKTGIRASCRSNPDGKSYTCDYSTMEDGNWVIRNTDCNVCNTNTREDSKNCIVSFVDLQMIRKECNNTPSEYSRGFQP